MPICKTSEQHPINTLHPGNSGKEALNGVS